MRIVLEIQNAVALSRCEMTPCSSERLRCTSTTQSNQRLRICRLCSERMSTDVAHLITSRKCTNGRSNGSGLSPRYKTKLGQPILLKRNHIHNPYPQKQRSAKSTHRTHKHTNQPQFADRTKASLPFRSFSTLVTLRSGLRSLSTTSMTSLSRSRPDRLLLRYSTSE